MEFTRENQTNYGVNAQDRAGGESLPSVSNLSIGGLDRNGANANGQTDTFGIYAFDTLTLTERIEINGGLVSTITIPNMTAPPPARQRTRGYRLPARTVDRQPGHHCRYR
ncbi:ferrichrome-iron receptor [Klebsiella pneumoniae]|uniref:Ferrichrome-iron receptor n=1 Tax=Klebsiella pneumoniae TaxID=573 RepID=A0A378BER7_KLEPN|nr:ferrichrome-iron receptor [Klebsiella pneumoniae]